MNNNYFNFNTDIEPPIKIKLEVDPLPDFDKLSNKLVNNTKIADKINKKNNDYYNLYKDFNEKTNNLDIVHKLEKAPFLFWNQHPKNYFERYTNEKQCREPTCQDADNVELVKEAFFLRENIEIIQNAIIRNVAKKSKYLISRQKEDDIILLMNGIYHDYSRNLPYDLKEQILDLNDRVVNFITPWLINEVEAYQRYLIDSNTPLRPPELPVRIVKQRKESLPSVYPR
jgi:hypothetical protein